MTDRIKTDMYIKRCSCGEPTVDRKKLIEKCKALQLEHMKAWEFLHQLVHDAKMPGGDLIFFDYPIKTSSLEVYDNIHSIIEAVINHIEKID